jgi:hypothetical protein
MGGVRVFYVSAGDLVDQLNALTHSDGMFNQPETGRVVRKEPRMLFRFYAERR